MSVGRKAGEPYPLAVVGPTIGRTLVAKCHELTAGVGDAAAGFWHKMGVAVHFRSPLTDAEMAMLPDGWLACPAVDRGGCEDIMTRTPPWSDAA